MANLTQRIKKLTKLLERDGQPLAYYFRIRNEIERLRRELNREAVEAYDAFMRGDQ